MTKQELINSFDAEPTLVLFTAPWCGPCKALKPQVMEWAEAHDFNIAIIDATVSTDLRDQFGIRTVPCAFIYDNLGQESKVKSPNASFIREELIRFGMMKG